LAQALESGAEALNIDLTSGQVERLVTHVRLIEKWNRSFNLVSRRDVSRLGTRHVLDSLCGVELLRGPDVLDLGSGAGLPGIPLAVAAPHCRFTLVERSARRARFLKQAVAALELDNVQVRHAEFPDPHAAERRYDTVVARAVATAQAVWDMVHGHLRAGGRVLVYESTRLQLSKEVGAPKGALRMQRHRFEIPGLDQSHSIVCLERA